MADGLARQIAGLAGDIRNLGKRIPSYQRGVVANVSPPTVIMDRDVTATPRPVADVLVPGLAVGQRVEVRVIGSRRVITSIHPGDLPAPIDTGWVSVPTESEVSGTIECRRIDVLVSLRAAVTLTIPATSTTPIGTLPAEFRPPGTYGLPAVWSAGQIDWGQITSAGVVRVRKPTAGTNTGLNLAATYLMS